MNIYIHSGKAAVAAGMQTSRCPAFGVLLLPSGFGATRWRDKPAFAALRRGEQVAAGHGQSNRLTLDSRKIAWNRFFKWKPDRAVSFNPVFYGVGALQSTREYRFVPPNTGMYRFILHVGACGLGLGSFKASPPSRRRLRSHPVKASQTKILRPIRVKSLETAYSRTNQEMSWHYAGH
jgi:hypothetical protein